VPEDHEAIEELLAGYVLRGLAGEDAVLADGLLSDHVPSCPACRDTLAVFQTITADLAFAERPLPPPETLLPRLHRELGSQARRRGPASVFAVAAGFVVVVGLGGLALLQGARAGGMQQRADDVSQILDFAGQNGARISPLSSTDAAQAPMTEISAPGVEEFYVYGRDIADPPPGMVYRCWLVSSTGARPVGDFVPDDGYVLLRFASVDPSRFDSVVISIEPAGSTVDAPTEPIWEAAG
jgi:hypothetical protein